jgi:general stress protein 26
VVDKNHVRRIKTELVAAGVSTYGLLKSESRYLPQIIHPDEHIKAVVYGQHNNSSAMLVATKERIIYVDKKPTVTIRDDLMYSVVIGIEFDIHTIFATVVLQTNVGNYVMRYANINCAEKFSNYVEAMMVAEGDKGSDGIEEKIENKTNDKLLASNRGLKFLQDHSTGVLSSVDRDGEVRGSTVHYIVKGMMVYVLSKAGTKKVHNLLVHNQVCLTVFNQDSLQTMQLLGIAEVVSDEKLNKEIIEQMIKPRNYGGKTLPPPITRLDASGYVVLQITPVTEEYFDYKT